MVRRFFVSAVSTVVALTASALYPGGAAKAQSAPRRTGMPFSFPEPEPIVVDQATFDRARELLDAVAHGTFDRSELSPELSDVTPDFFAKAPTVVGSLGPPRSMFPFEKRITADKTATFFRVRYPKEILTWVVGVDAANRINQLSLRRGPESNIFSVVYRDIGY
ncbi:MAG TPA: hypothetical protein VGI19_01670 [Candidatus Cybelea sp.]|jgi:hypothetical protein